MNIDGIQRILHDAVKEYELVANVPNEVFVTLISADIYRKLNAKVSANTAPRLQARRNPAPKNVPGQMSIGEGGTFSD